MKTKLMTFTYGLLLVVLCASCAGHRPPQTRAQLMERRAAQDAELTESGWVFRQRMGDRLKAKYDARSGEPAIADVLIISGGGDWGAFGAGFLKGWSRVQGPMAKPEFDIVTGVSTGALISPFAFLGDEESINNIDTLYRNPKREWVKKRWPLYFLPSNQSFATVPGLERGLRERVDAPLLRRLADANQQGRFLFVSTTDLDDGGFHIFDIGQHTELALQSGDINRLHKIFPASSGIPGAFPFREIDGAIYVDGAVTGNILYGGGTKDEHTLPAVWAAAYPQLPMPKFRFWVIFNNQLRARPQVTTPTWVGAVTRSVELGSRAATVTAIRHLFALAELSELKHGGEFEVRVAAVPNDFAPPKPGPFVKETMNALADLGEKDGGRSRKLAGVTAVSGNEEARS